MCSVVRNLLVCVRRVVYVAGHIGLSMQVRMCLQSCTLFRNLLSYIFVREFLVQDVLYLHPPSVTVDCRQL